MINVCVVPEPFGSVVNSVIKLPVICCANETRQTNQFLSIVALLVRIPGRCCH